MSCLSALVKWWFSTIPQLLLLCCLAVCTSLLVVEKACWPCPWFLYGVSLVSRHGGLSDALYLCIFSSQSLASLFRLPILYLCLGLRKLLA